MSAADSDSVIGQAERHVVRCSPPLAAASNYSVLIARSHEDNTMNRIISALLLAATASLCAAQDSPLQLADTAPGQNQVAPGDTLWGISARFLREPWRWPEIWRMNKGQIKNPHRIYPGDVLVLDRDASGNPYLRKQDGKLQPKIHSEPIVQAIPPIPPNVIEPFISEPLIVEDNALENNPRIIATQQDRVFLGNGDLAYVKDADRGKENWHVYRNGKPLLDPEDDKQVLGYEAFYLGTARQVRPGEPATFEIRTAKQEIGRGDRLIPATGPALVDYIPHRPDTQIDGRIISIYGGVGSAGVGPFVSFDRGAQDGLEIGHVLALQRNRTVYERDQNDRRISVKIPSERIGLIFVFRTFERISYALVLQSEGTVEINDYVQTP